jgi:hypothetical protein
MKKVLKLTGMMALMMALVLSVSAFTKVTANNDVTSGEQYSCKVEIFLPDGSHYIQGNIEVWFHKGSWTDEGGYAKYWVDSDGKCTIQWDSKRGDYIEYISFSDSGRGYVIKDLELSNGGSYKLTAKEN